LGTAAGWVLVQWVQETRAVKATAPVAREVLAEALVPIQEATFPPERPGATVAASVAVWVLVQGVDLLLERRVVKATARVAAVALVAGLSLVEEANFPPETPPATVAASAAGWVLVQETDSLQETRAAKATAPVARDVLAEAKEANSPPATAEVMETALAPAEASLLVQETNSE
jgi:hypothetical protein